jgi:glycine cleavage system H protein
VEIDGCRVPDDLRVDVENGLWVRSAADGRATLGLLAPFVAFAGRLSSVTFRPLTGRIARGSSVATVESSRLTAPVRIPVDAERLEPNPRVPERPRLVHDEPYGDGWLVTFRPLEAVSERLPTALEARDLVERQILERRIRCYAALPDLEVYEIGTECRAILARLDDELAQRPVGDVVLLVVDDPTAPLEMARWSDRTGYPILEQRLRDGLLHFLVRKVSDPRPLHRGPGGQMSREP